MRIWIQHLLSILVFALVSVGLRAHAVEFGLGVIIGSPTGISAKGFLDKKHAIDAAVAWDLAHDNDFTLHGDYLWHKFAAFKLETAPIDWYYGVGGRVVNRSEKKKSESLFGARIPTGLSYTFRSSSIEIFGEIAVIVNVIPSTGVDLSLGVGARYFF